MQFSSITLPLVRPPLPSCMSRAPVASSFQAAARAGASRRRPLLPPFQAVGPHPVPLTSRRLLPVTGGNLLRPPGLPPARRRRASSALLVFPLPEDPAQPSPPRPLRSDVSRPPLADRSLGSPPLAGRLRSLLRATADAAAFSAPLLRSPSALAGHHPAVFQCVGGDDVIPPTGTGASRWRCEHIFLVACCILAFIRLVYL